MTKGLEEYSTQELYDELRERDDVFDANLWMREDVERALSDAGVSLDAADDFMYRFDTSFHDRTTELGFEVMDIYINELL